jgi:hypothetical protein
LDYKLIDTAMDYVRKNALGAGGDVVEWPKYEKMVMQRLKTEFDPRPKMPKEYYYAYLRVKGLKHAECLDKMGLGADDDAPAAGKKSFWKFW